MNTINLQKLASKLEAMRNCAKSNNTDWYEKHEADILEMLENLPSGSGLDAGIKFNWQTSNSKKLVFSFSFHHLNEDGYYDGWTNHALVITPAFGSYDMRITGKDKNQIKEYLYDLFSEVFTVTEEITA